jgi:amidohydrolase
MDNITFDVDLNYMIHLRRQLHMYPETGFDLLKTQALIRQELKRNNVWFTENCGDSSFIAILNDELKDKGSVALRADLDALGITEENQVSYKSKNIGKMHACGHDVHTAILLGVIRTLISIKEKIPCRIIFIFQAAEECGGAKTMVRDGVADYFDIIAGCHVSNDVPVGKIEISNKTAFAASRTFQLVFFGKTAHAATPEKAIDAIQICVDAYKRIKEMSVKICPKNESHILSICTIEGGRTTNMIADQCSIKGTIRTENNETMNQICREIEIIAKELSELNHGKHTWKPSAGVPALINDIQLVEALQKSALRVGAKVNIRNKPVMLSEDFAILRGDKPCVFFLLGTGNQSKGITAPLHSSRFDVDEQALRIGALTMVQFVLDISGQINNLMS